MCRSDSIVGEKHAADRLGVENRVGGKRVVARLSPTQKGDIAQASICAALIELGYEVLLPFSAGCRYDLAVAIGSRICRVQCKLAKIDKRHATEAVRFWTASSRRQQGIWTKTAYTTDCDLLVAYCRENRQSYAIAADKAPATQVSLLLGQAQNGQVIGVRVAEEYQLARVKTAIAQSFEGR